MDEIVVAILLAIVPYPVLCGLVNLLARKVCTAMVRGETMKRLLCRSALAGLVTLTAFGAAASEATPGAAPGPSPTASAPSTTAIPVAATGGPQQATAGAGPAELIVANRKIVTLRATVGTLTPSARVAAAKARLKALNEADLESPAVFKPTTFAGQPATAIEVNDKYVLLLLTEDLDRTAGERLDDVTRLAVAELNAAREAFLELHQSELVLKKAGLIAVAALAFLLAWRLLSRLHRRLRVWLVGVTERHIARLAATGLDLKSFAMHGGQRALAVFYCGTVAIVAYLWLTYVLGLFAYSRPWRDRVVGWLLDLLVGLLEGSAAAIPGLVAAAIIFVLARLAVRGMRALLARVEHGDVQIPGLYPETAPATRSIATVLIWLFALTVAYPYLPGSGSDVFKGVSLFAGLMVTLGSTGIVAQWMSGMMLVYSRALRPGDLIKAGDNEGVVASLGLLSTKLRTAAGEEITIPNAAIVSGSIHNFTRLSGDAGTRVSTTVTIGYDAPWRQVHAMLLAAAARTPGLRAEPAPFVLQRALNDFYVEYELVGRIDTPLERPFVMTRLHGHVQDVFNEYGVQIMSPHFENQPTQPVVVDKRQWFAAPASPEDARPAESTRDS